jgi:hypothetical protein
VKLIALKVLFAGHDRAQVHRKVGHKDHAMEGRMKKIETAKEAAEATLKLGPAKLKMLVDGLRAQHAHLRNCSDEEIRGRLSDFIARSL